MQTNELHSDGFVPLARQSTSDSDAASQAYEAHHARFQRVNIGQQFLRPITFKNGWEAFCAGILPGLAIIAIISVSSKVEPALAGAAQADIRSGQLVTTHAQVRQPIAAPFNDGSLQANGQAAITDVAQTAVNENAQPIYDAR